MAMVPTRLSLLLPVAVLCVSRKRWRAALAGMLRDVRRWATAYATIGPRQLAFHYASQRKVHGCLACGRLRLPHEVYFVCGQCDDWELCEVCHDARARKHDHRLYPEVQPQAVDTTPLAAARCTAEILAGSFELYAPRPCLGWRARTADGYHAEYSWLSYAAAGEAALAVGAGLEVLLSEGAETAVARSPHGRFVGVFGAVCVEWMLADYACALKGLPVVLCHRSTTAEQLAHILSEAHVAALVTSTHLLSVVRHAAARVDGAPWLRHVIVYDDDCEAYAMHAEAHAQAGRDGCAPPPTLKWSEHSWAAVRELGALQPTRVRSRVAHVTPETLVKLLPSSGSTGLPKLVVVTVRLPTEHRTIVATCNIAMSMVRRSVSRCAGPPRDARPHSRRLTQ
jgi:non-ribosomal peptide synthetase component F